MYRFFSSLVIGAAFLGIAAASAGEISGKFDGEITPSGCRSSRISMFTGTIADGRVKGTVNRKSFDWELKSDGSFAGQMFLRNHRRGDKMQFYKGKVVDGKIIIKARYGVPGYSQTFCTGAGEFPLK